MSESTSQPADALSKVKIRTFLALELPDALRAGVAEIIARLQKGVMFTGAHPKWVDPASIHLTLKFFGDTTLEQRDEILHALRPVAKRHAPHRVRLEGIGVFPTPRQPRVLWLGVKKAHALNALQEAIDAALDPIGWETEEREYRPHLTLARIKGQRRTQPLMDVVRSHRGLTLGEWPVNEMVLMQSTLRPAGAEYISLARIPLTGTEPPPRIRAAAPEVESDDSD
jgi:2'-5' RNA ligase